MTENVREKEQYIYPMSVFSLNTKNIITIGAGALIAYGVYWFAKGATLTISTGPSKTLDMEIEYDCVADGVIYLTQSSKEELKKRILEFLGEDNIKGYVIEENPSVVPILRSGKGKANVSLEIAKSWINGSLFITSKAETFTSIPTQ